MTDRTPEEINSFVQLKSEAFFNSLSPSLKTYVESLPQRIEVMNARTFVKLAEVLKTADLLFSQAASFSACMKGCSHCCYQAVPITDIEARYIGEKIKTKNVELRQSISHDLTSLSDQTPCPFLANSECVIYEYRPLTCRTHVNFDRDNHFCRYENWNKPGGTVPKLVIHSLLFAYQQLAGKFEPTVGDIRDFFPNGRVL